MVGELGIFGGLEEDAGFSGEFAIGHFTDTDGVFNESESVEELNDVVLGHTVGETAHLEGGLSGLLLFDFLIVDVVQLLSES